MSFWGKVGGGLRATGRGAVKVGKAVAPVGEALAVPVAGLVGGPLLAQHVSNAIHGIKEAQRKHGKADGAMKHAEVANALLPAIFASIEAGLDRELVDESKIQSGTDELIRGLVAILKATGQMEAPDA